MHDDLVLYIQILVLIANVVFWIFFPIWAYSKGYKKGYDQGVDVGIEIERDL